MNVVPCGYFNPLQFFTNQHMRLRYLSGCRALKAQTNLRKCVCSSEFHQKTRVSEVRRKLENKYRIAKENRICNSDIPLPL